MTVGSRPPRLDPYGVLPMLEVMTSQQIGEFAYPFMRAALLGRADTASVHILDLCGWALRQREDTTV